MIGCDKPESLLEPTNTVSPTTRSKRRSRLTFVVGPLDIAVETVFVDCRGVEEHVKAIRGWMYYKLAKIQN
jgi:hypothetical protein